jgi:L-fuconolactonase
MTHIDAHMHLWDPQRGDYVWLTPLLQPLYRRFGPEDAKPLLDASRVDGVVLVQAAPSESETEYLLSIAHSTPWVRGVVGWLDFDAPHAIERVRRWSSRPKLVGLRPMLQDLPDPAWILDSRRTGVLQAIAECSLVFDALVRPLHLNVIDALARRHPDLRIVVDHAAKPDIGPRIDAGWRTGMQRLAQHANVHCKFSGLMTQLAPGTPRECVGSIFAELLEMFGVERLIWGSDWPVLTMAATYEVWRSASLDAIERLAAASQDAILGGNAIRTYRLEEQQ